MEKTGKYNRRVALLVQCAILSTILAACSTVQAGRPGFPVSNRKGGDIQAGAEVCECTARSCEIFGDELFRDLGWRYTKHPYENKDGFYVNSVGSQELGAQAFASYIMVRRNSTQPPMYGVTGAMHLSLPSGFTLHASYLYAEEDIRAPGYLHYNYFRLGTGHLLTSDLNSWTAVGVNLIRLDVEEGEFPDPPDDDNDAIGIGIAGHMAFFIRKPFILKMSASTAATVEGPVTDIEATAAYADGQVHYAIGYRALYWQQGEIKGLFVSVGFWF